MPANIDQHFIRNEEQTEVRPQSRGGGGDGGVILEGGDLVYTRPTGGEADGWLLFDADPDSDFYGMACHGDPQTVKLDTSSL